MGHHRNNFTFLGLLLAVFTFYLFPAQTASPFANYPILVANPPSIRQKIVGTAKSFLGIGYVYGGEDRGGMDCSGLVFTSYFKATGYKIPRTVKELARWVLPISANELQPGDLVFFSLSANSSQNLDRSVSDIDMDKAISRADHVGIYAGGGIFIHSASAGAKTGVMYSSLSDQTWSKRYLFAGRAISPQAFSGIYADLFVGATLDNHTGSVDWLPFSIRGAEIGLGVALPVGSSSHPLFEIGLQTRFSYDALLGVARIPFELNIATKSGFSVFLGPTITVGSPVLPATATVSTATAISFDPVSAWIASAGIRWAPLTFRNGPGGSGPYFELRYDRYMPAAESKADSLDTMRASLSLGLGFRFRGFF
jgi:probable lipoprotein NlpC